MISTETKGCFGDTKVCMRGGGEAATLTSRLEALYERGSRPHMTPEKRPLDRWHQREAFRSSLSKTFRLFKQRQHHNGTTRDRPPSGAAAHHPEPPWTNPRHWYLSPWKPLLQDSHPRCPTQRCILLQAGHFQGPRYWYHRRIRRRQDSSASQAPELAVSYRFEFPGLRSRDQLIPHLARLQCSHGLPLQHLR